MGDSVPGLYSKQAHLTEKLKAIASIKVNTKFDVSELKTHKNGIWTTIARTTLKWGSESRAVTIAFVRETMEESVKLIKKFNSLGDEHLKTAMTLSVHLEDAISGFLNLRVTYWKDEVTRREIQAVVESIKKSLAGA